ncbi:tight junction-associated protein 1-like [Gigantopelta aegis]|uniref:tight junction-associated protein 1-like n=1 Tax=Gigantopelta aegis TaxID=1735272 RepID=UPI001B88A634|nr:tight junction-associated protein 1-like [Gigantopelta aegis]XP_041352730.1 tight junction-associated protein 1-like [Gigantopelta aegis]
MKPSHSRKSPEIVVPIMANVCKKCGCTCESCFTNSTSLDLHQEIEELQFHLIRSKNHISQLEHELADNKQLSEYELVKFREEFARLRDRYERLMESHKRMQKVNHDLEDKLLKIVNKFEGEKISLQRELASITSRLIESKVMVCELEEENDRCRRDCNLAVQLLHCKPSTFVAHKLNSLPVDLQDRVKDHMTREQIRNLENSRANETKLIRVPIATFPPTAMFYSVNPTLNESNANNAVQGVSPTDTVPMSIITKVLSQPTSKQKSRWTHICLKCGRDVSLLDKEVQVNFSNVTEITGFPQKVNRLNGKHLAHVRLNSTETEI